MLIWAIWELALDRAAEWANEQIDESTPKIMTEIIRIVDYVATTPLAWSISIAVFVLLILLLHSYYVEYKYRRTINKELSGEIPSNLETIKGEDFSGKTISIDGKHFILCRFKLASSTFPPGEDRDRAVKNRDIAAERMTPAQISEAQKLAREWRPKK